MPVYNLFVDDLSTVEPPDLEHAIVKLARSGIEEKFRLDFKEKWDPEKQCMDIVALANSYGGLLVIGVSDDRQHFPGTVPPRNSDLKTQISSVIASRISPVPLFEVHTCPAPDDRNNSLVLIRVSPQPRVHMYLKGDKPVYIRNEDGSKPAGAAELRARLDRVRTAEQSTALSIDPLAPVARNWWLTKPNPSGKPGDNRVRSETALTIGIAPELPLGLALDVTLEDRFKRLIHETYPAVAQRASVDLGMSLFESEDRAGAWFRFQHFDRQREHEMVWVLGSNGLIQGMFQLAGTVGGVEGNLWSITDLFLSLESTLLLAHSVWRSVAFFGAGQFTASLDVSGLRPFVVNGEHHSVFYGASTSLPGSAIRQSEGKPVSQATAGMSVSYDGRTSLRRASVVNIGNHLLRDLRFGVDTQALRAAFNTFRWFADVNMRPEP